MSLNRILLPGMAYFRQQSPHAKPPSTPHLPTPHAVATASPASGADTTGSPRHDAVRFDNVSKVYAASTGEVAALQAIDLSVPAGSIFGIIGRSGAGKSSLLRTINRLESPSTGHVYVAGQDIATLDEDGLVALRRRVGMIFQHFNLLSAKTVFDNVALPLRVAGVRPAQVRERVNELLHLVGLDGKQNVYPARLSGGQKQRVGIARALVHHPDILLCDEATSALDPETTHAILALLRDIHRKLGLTIVLITHEMGVIREICDQVVVLEQGRIAEQGPVWKVFGQPEHDATRALLRTVEQGLPHDLLQSIQPEPPATGEALRVLQLTFTGEGGIEPDLGRIAETLGHKAQLLHGGIDRIQGHAHGRLIIATRSSVPAQTLVLGHLAHHAKELGYV